LGRLVKRMFTQPIVGATCHSRRKTSTETVLITAERDGARKASDIDRPPAERAVICAVLMPPPARAACWTNPPRDRHAAACGGSGKHRCRATLRRADGAGRP